MHVKTIAQSAFWLNQFFDNVQKQVEVDQRIKFGETLLQVAKELRSFTALSARRRIPSPCRRIRSSRYRIRRNFRSKSTQLLRKLLIPFWAEKSGLGLGLNSDFNDRMIEQCYMNPLTLEWITKAEVYLSF
jgi:hypothetical protein